MSYEAEKAQIATSCEVVLSAYLFFSCFLGSWTLGLEVKAEYMMDKYPA